MSSKEFGELKGRVESIQGTMVDIKRGQEKFFRQLDKIGKDMKKYTDNLANEQKQSCAKDFCEIEKDISKLKNEVFGDDDKNPGLKSKMEDLDFIPKMRNKVIWFCITFTVLFFGGLIYAGIQIYQKITGQHINI